MKTIEQEDHKSETNNDDSNKKRDKLLKLAEDND